MKTKRADFARVEEGRKEMFYLTTHSTYFIYGYMASAGVEEMHDAVVCTSLHA